MEEEKAVILMVEDEPEVLRVNARLLKRHGYSVLTAENAQQAYEYLEKYIPDLLFLDIMLPDGSGYDICKRFREKSDHPVLFLTGKSASQDIVKGLQLGGDYYLTKPYNIDELLAVVGRLVERQQQNNGLKTIRKGALVLDIQKFRATLNGKDVGLTGKEFALLLMLVRNEDKELTAQELYKTVWNESAENDIRTIRTHIGNLRKKIDADNSNDYDIISSYGKGYFFTCFC